MNALARQIEQEISQHGAISFARFMALALYAPGLGYYERRREIGREGDFFTSVSVGPLLGQSLAFQFAQWMDTDVPEGDIQFIEAGPHNGALALDILVPVDLLRCCLHPAHSFYAGDVSQCRRQRLDTSSILLPEHYRHYQAPAPKGKGVGSR